MSCHKHKKHADYYGYGSEYAYPSSYYEKDSGYEPYSSGPDYSGPDHGPYYKRHEHKHHKDEVGECWYEGTTDFGIRYNANVSITSPIPTFINFIW